MPTTDTEPFALRWVKEAPERSTIYCILRHVSQSGMQRVIDLVVIDGDEPRYLRSIADDPRWTYKVHPKYDGFRVNGVGMDMGFSLVYDLGRIFHDDGYYFTHRWL